MKPISCARLARMAGGMLDARKAHIMISSMCIDSRSATRGSLFIALSGSSNNGHDYVAKAMKNGSCAAMVDTRHALLLRRQLPNFPLIVVDDTRAALEKMAASHVASHSGVRKVGITGSCGKTTTKEMISSILSTVGVTAKTPGNYNTEIGLALSVFEIDDTTEFSVYEMGIDTAGEMDRMLSIYRPDVSVITTIGMSHVGKMGSMQAIAEEKAKIFHPEARAAFLAEDNRWTPHIAKTYGRGVSLFGPTATDGIRSIEPLGIDGYNIVYDGRRIRLNAIGKHNLMNALASIAVTQKMGIPSDAIAEGLQRFVPLTGRSRLCKGDVTVIEDWYNASFDSTTSILSYLATLRYNGKKKVVLGSMKELGAFTQQAHAYIGRMLVSMRIDKAYLYGEEMKDAWNAMRRQGYAHHMFYTDDQEELQKQLIYDTHRGDLVLVKGSRAMAMERFVPAVSSHNDR